MIEVHDTHNIKEIELSEKESTTNYLLFLYSESLEPHSRYMFLNTSIDLTEIKDYANNWDLKEGQTLRIFKMNLPN